MNIFDFVKSKVSILDVVNEYANLKPTGIYWKGNCPFHSEKTPSFTVSPHKGIFYCFGCHEGGDIISFIAKIEGCNQREAANSLIDKHGIKVPEEYLQKGAKEAPSLDSKKQYFKICEQVAQWCYENLKENKEASSYVAKRKLNEEAIRKYSIGYFPPQSTKRLLNFCHKSGIVAKDLILAGILAEGKTQIYSPFENRIIFPIKDLIGRFCGFGGRVFKKDDERAKYYNSKENDFFSKGHLLFGLDIAKEEIRKKGSVFLVEGYTDCTALFQAGFKNTVATLGTSCTADHLKILNRFASEVYVLYDGDSAGQEAILRLTELCWDVSLDLKVICLPNKEDPASFIQSGGDLNLIIKDKKSIYAFYTEMISLGFQTKNLDQKLKSVGKLIEMISKVEDPIKRDLLIQDAASAMNLPIESLAKRLKSNNISSNQQQPKIVKNKLERTIVSAVLNDFSLADQRVEALVIYFSKDLQQILKNIIQLKGQGFNLFYENLNEDERRLVNEIVLEFENEWIEIFDELLNRFQKQNWKRITESFKVMISNTTDQNEVKKMLSQFQSLKSRMLHFN